MNGIQGTCGMRYTKELDRFSLINRRNIQYANYTQALITEALRVGLRRRFTTPDHGAT